MSIYSEDIILFGKHISLALQVTPLESINNTHFRPVIVIVMVECPERIARVSHKTLRISQK